MSCQALAQAAQAMGESPPMGGFKRLLEARQAVLAHLSWQHSELDGSSCAVVAPCLSVGTGRKSSWVVLGMEVVGTQLSSAPGTRQLHQGPSGATWNEVLGFALHQGFSRVRSPVHSRNCTQVHIRQNLRRKVQGQKAWTGNTAADQGPEKGLPPLLPGSLASPVRCRGRRFPSTQLWTQ